MHRCFVKPEDWNESEIRLSRAEEHHLLHVLRAGTGDVVSVFDGRGREARARIVACETSSGTVTSSTGSGRKSERSHRAVLRMLAPARVVPPPSCRITLIQALPKGRGMDLIVEKAAELGVSVIVPVISERVVARPSGRQRRERETRWRRIALSAAGQCGSSWIPDVAAIAGCMDVLGGCGPFDLFLVGSLGDDARPFHSVVDKAVRRKPRRIALLIGPEGDLTPEEIREAINAGAVPVGFGPLILRVETAALYGLSVLAYSFLRESGAG